MREKTLKNSKTTSSPHKYIIREKMPVYLGSSPKASSQAVSKSMKKNTPKNTKPEKILRKALWSSNLRGYRLNYKKLPGSPDIYFPKYKLAIFVNGCFWHRCPICDLPLPKKNTDFWEKKFFRNKERDILKRERLESIGLKVILLWECEIKKDIKKILEDLIAITHV